MKHGITVVALGFVVLTSFARADSVVVELAGQLGGACEAVDVVGDIAYVGSGPRLLVLNVSDASNPVLLGRSDVLVGVVMDVFVSGNYAYLADDHVGLQIIDVSDPNNPSWAGEYQTSGNGRGVAVAGNYAYVADYYDGLEIIDVSDPNNPSWVSEYLTSGNARGVAVAGNYAYVADYSYGLQIIDVSDPDNPLWVGEYQTSGYAQGVAVAGNYAYVADCYDGLQIIDVSDPDNPLWVGEYQTSGYAQGVTVAGDYAYVAAYSGLQIIDVSDPDNPSLAGVYQTSGNGRSVTVAGDYAYVADYSGLQIIDVSDPNGPSWAGEYPASGMARDVVVAGNHAYVADYFYFQIIDVADPNNPSWAGGYPMGGRGYGVGVAGDYAFVADYDYGLQVIDVSDPNNPSRAGGYHTSGAAYGVAVAGNYAYVADYSYGLQVIDVSDPNNPSRAGGYHTSGAAYGVAVAGNYAYVADYDYGLQVIDVSDPDNPLWVGEYQTSGYPQGVAVAGNYAYVADGFGLQIIDVSDPSSPSWAGDYCTGNAWRVTVAGDYAYVTSAYALAIIDVSDPNSPSLAGGWYPMIGSAYGVAVAGNYAYVADFTGGLVVLKVSPDCNDNGTPDDEDIADCDPDDPTCQDCNANGVPDECDIDDCAPGDPGCQDCNTNGTPDACDIANCDPDDPTCQDCNGNGILDECDLADCDPGDPACQDCDTNGTPDACDIANCSGDPACEDCNLNGIPDGCELQLLAVYGFDVSSPHGDDTIGGEMITFDGWGFMTGMSVVFTDGFHDITADPAEVTASSGGTKLSVVVPAFPPGCECVFGLPFDVNVLFDNGCDTADLYGSTEDLFTYSIVLEDVFFPDDVQVAIDNAAPGTCLVLEADANHIGPVVIDSFVERITVTGADPFEPGRTQIDGEYMGGTTAPDDATITFDGCGSDVCLASLSAILGNSGAYIHNGAQPLIMGCNFDNNFSSIGRGGGITIYGYGTEPPRPIIFGGCLIAVNEGGGNGGGIGISYASAIIIGNSIWGNAAVTSGGGIAAAFTPSDLVIADNDIWLNDFPHTAGGSTPEPINGGGVYWYGGTRTDPTRGLLLRNDISMNTADEHGGGVYVGAQAAPFIIGNTIRNNAVCAEPEDTGFHGGGLYVEEFNRHLFSICGNVITANEARLGGGMALMKKCEAMVYGNLVYCNQATPPTPYSVHYAPGILVDDAGPCLFHNTIYGNSGTGNPDTCGGGIHCEAVATGAPKFWDNLIFGNDGWEFYSDLPLAESRVDWNLTYDGDDPESIYSPLITPGPESITADPQVSAADCAPANPWVDFGLLATSPGACTASDGCDRGAVFDPDCGSCVPGDCLPDNPDDCNRNGIPDRVDLLIGASTDLDWNGVLDECEGFTPLTGDLDNDGCVDLDDFTAFHGCMSGPETTIPPGCGAGIFTLCDTDSDGDVDLEDFDVFMRAFTDFQ